MNRRGFFKTILAGTAGLCVPTLPSPAESKPQHNINIDCSYEDDVTFINIFHDGKLVDCKQIDHSDNLAVHIEAHREWVSVNDSHNDNYF